MSTIYRERTESIIYKKTNKLKKIHDLVELGKDVELPNNLIEYCKELTLSYIYARYPDIKEEKNIRDISRKFLEYSEEILEWIRKKL